MGRCGEDLFRAVREINFLRIVVLHQNSPFKAQSTTEKYRVMNAQDKVADFVE